jgi:hypothetical protein
MNLFLAIVALYIVYAYADIDRKTVACITAAAWINIAYWLCQKSGFNPVYDVMPYKGQEGGFIGNQPRLVTYLALVVPFMPVVGIIAGLAMGLWTGQYIIFLPVALALFFRIKGRDKKMLFAAACLIALFFMAGHIYKALAFRFSMSYSPVLSAFFDRPLVGFGLGARIIPELEVIGSSYLQFIAGVGILGVVWFWYIFKSLRNRIEFGIGSLPLITLALVMLVEYPIEIPRFWFLIIAVIAMHTIKHETA